MKKVRFAIVGMGNRGMTYAQKLMDHPDTAEVTAIADTRPIQTETANKMLHLPLERIFSSAEALLAQPKLADVLIVATQDGQHREHALRAMELGYDLVLEKPIANTLADCIQIAQRARALGRQVFVCHVLRYTVFYRQIKRLLDQGTIGRIESIEAMEQVGYYHFAHSFVRGNWHSQAHSSPMILAKCCHDMDMLLWLAGKNCLRVSSFGSLDYFKGENAPAGAAERCESCALDCPYNAQRFYLSRIPGWPSKVLHPEPTPENILEILKTSDYGKCVYRMDNDVVDHQSVSMLLEGGVTVTFQMIGFTNRQTRTIRIMGSEGEIWGDFEEKRLSYQRFGGPVHTVDLDALCADFSGHGGGDDGLIHDVIRYLQGVDFDSASISTIDRSVESHYLAFAAEKSRREGGALVDMERFKAEAGLQATRA